MDTFLMQDLSPNWKGWRTGTGVSCSPLVLKLSEFRGQLLSIISVQAVWSHS